MNRKLLLTAVAAILLTACRQPTGVSSDYKAELKKELTAIADSAKGDVGIALIYDGDTLTVNNDAIYPMMSVFKLHQAVALCRMFEENGTSLDSVMTLRRSELDPDTWSPMLKDHSDEEISLPMRRLLEYTLIESDNNASNEMFVRLMPPAACDSVIAGIIPRGSFEIRFNEAEMQADHSRAYSNRTSPLGAAILIDRLFTDTLVGKSYQDFIKSALLRCQTGPDKISAALSEREGITIGHKTGSGYRDDNGRLAASNDVAFITLPDGRHYSLAVFVKDFDGTDAEAAATIARISAAVIKALE
ncbi:MAG: serine hydrolase [Muribaculaceae bacterium]